MTYKTKKPINNVDEELEKAMKEKTKLVDLYGSLKGLKPFKRECEIIDDLRCEIKKLKKRAKRNCDESESLLYHIRENCFLRKLISSSAKHFKRRYGVCKACKGKKYPIQKRGLLKGAGIECCKCHGLGFNLPFGKRSINLYAMTFRVPKRKARRTKSIVEESYGMFKTKRQTDDVDEELKKIVKKKAKKWSGGITPHTPRPRNRTD